MEFCWKGVHQLAVRRSGNGVRRINQATLR